MAQAPVSLPSLPQFPAPFFQPPAPPSPYRKLKEMDELLDSVHASLSGARQLYQRTLQDFAVLCHDLWQQEKAQGNREGKGFRKGLRDAGIKVGRAYQAMKKFFPADFPAKRKSLTKKKFSTLFTVNNVVGLRFTGKLPEGKEALRCIFALTPEEKTQFAQALNSVEPAQLQQLFLQALKQAVQCPPSQPSPISPPPANQDQSRIELAALRSSRNAVNGGVSASSDPLASRGPLGRCERSELSQQLEAKKSQIPNNDTVCNGIALAPNTPKSEIKNHQSQILPEAFPGLLSQVAGSSLAPQGTMSRPMRRFQKRQQEKKQRRLEKFLDQLLRTGQ